MLDELERRFGWVISYEDPAWLYEGDRVDVKTAVRLDNTAKPVLVPRGGPLAVSYDSAGSATNSLRVVNAVLAEHERAGYPGVFSAVEQDGMMHVIPIVARNRQGEARPWTSPLSIPVSLPDVAEETVFQRVQRIVDAVGRASGAEVALGAVPTGLLVRSQAPAGATAGSARSLMAQALSATRTPLTWRLLYAPDAGRWFLNVHVVQRPGIAAPAKQR